MIRRFGVFGSVGSLLAMALVAVVTAGASPASADSFADWSSISGNYEHTCGIRHGGKLYCWGSDSQGEVGDGPADLAVSPRRIGTFEDWANVSTGLAHTCGVRTNGKLYCWGANWNGQLGNGSTNPSDVPLRIGTSEDWANVSTGQGHTCGVRTTGELYCWGSDNHGQVGDGGGFDPNSITSPKRIGTFEDWANVSAGAAYTCGVRKNGKLYCWGYDDRGQVGDGDATPAADAPRRIGAGEDWARVSTGRSHSCGVRKDGRLYCWGWDEFGQVGDGGSDTTAIKTPRRIGSHEDWATVDAADGHTCGVRTNGNLYCWGSNGAYKLGNGSGGDEDTPKRVGDFADWTTASAGGSYSCGIRHGGKLYCWGSDGNYQLGNGDDRQTEKVPRRI
jgi:alpha-tubulin suppressor-like RCC1 family protein